MRRDLDAVTFVMIQAIRGIFLGMGLPHNKNVSKSAIKAELSRLLKSYLQLDSTPTDN